jgi:cytochrome c peroxidase
MKIFAVSLGMLFSLLMGLATAHAGREERLEKELRELYPKSQYSRSESPPFTDENPFSDEKKELGRVLFFDPRLSRTGNQSCVSCHHPGLGWEMGLAKALGAQEMPRKSQTLYNLAWSSTWFWDGRADSFSSQFHMALTSAKALNMTTEELELRLQSIAGYKPLFEKAFPAKKISEPLVGQALEIFQRTLVSGVAPFDRWVAGDANALSAEAKRGAIVFAKKANCIVCHSGWNFSDDGFHDIGLRDGDLGRGKNLNIPSMQHAFKTPGLRSITLRKPYMHDGSIATLEDVIEHYNRGSKVDRASVATELHPLRLSRDEKKLLLEFLKSLTGNDAPVSFPKMPM